MQPGSAGSERRLVGSERVHIEKHPLYDIQSIRVLGDELLCRRNGDLSRVFQRKVIDALHARRRARPGRAYG